MIFFVFYFPFLSDYYEEAGGARKKSLALSAAATLCELVPLDNIGKWGPAATKVQFSLRLAIDCVTKVIRLLYY